jgi:hypothetical protein
MLKLCHPHEEEENKSMKESSRRPIEKIKLIFVVSLPQTRVEAWNNNPRYTELTTEKENTIPCYVGKYCVLTYDLISPEPKVQAHLPYRPNL